MIFSLAACSKNSTSSDASSSSQSSEASEQTTAAETTAAEAAATGTTGNAEAAVPGVLYQLNAEENKEPVIKAAALDGNRIGNSEEGGVNGKALSADDIRSVFELNEWIYIRLVPAQKTGLKAYIVPHEDDEQTFIDSFAAKLNDDVPTVELNAPAAEDGADASWGDLYVNPESWQPGYYDLVFTSGEKPVARILIKLYAEGELEGKSDAELNAMMKAEKEK